MSIMCAVFVPEGIVLASDSRQTIGVTQVQKQQNTSLEPRVLNAMNRPEQPVQLVTQSDNAQKIVLLGKVRVGVSSCGIGIIGGRSVSDFIRTFETEKVREGDTVTAVAEKLHEYAKELFPQINFFVCGYEKDEPFVYSVGKELKRSNIENGKLKYASIWSGEQAAITKLLNGTPPMLINHVLMPLRDAVDLAEFLVDLTIKAQRFEMKVATCGGDIDLLVLTKDDAVWYRHKIFNPKRN